MATEIELLTKIYKLLCYIAKDEDFIKQLEPELKAELDITKTLAKAK